MASGSEATALTGGDPSLWPRGPWPQGRGPWRGRSLLLPPSALPPRDLRHRPWDVQDTAEVLKRWVSAPRTFQGAKRAGKCQEGCQEEVLGAATPHSDTGTSGSEAAA